LKLNVQILLYLRPLSPPARGRGLKPDLQLIDIEDIRRPPRGGVD